MLNNVSVKRSVDGKKLFLIAFFALFLDQLTKQLIRSGLWSFDLGFVQSTLTYNTGTLWSLFAGPQSNVIFIGISIIILAAVGYTFYKEPQHRVLLALIFVGGLGNLIDRILFGGVIDFINLGWFPIFNIADSLLSIGVILLLLQLLREEFQNSSWFSRPSK